jgi:hypothetical protein
VSDSAAILVSVVFVNYKVAHYLRQAIRSLTHAQRADQTEIIVVDNASGDNAEQIILREFPDVQWIGLKSNIGFAKACNVGARNARGSYVLFLNPDTLVSDNTLSACIEFMENHPKAGVVGPKTLNPDGSLQYGCRRSFPTPAVSFYRLSGLSRIFPKSKRFGRYNLAYLDPDVTAEVDALSGSFMFMSLPLFREIGGFDESFFMYGEDLDLCARVKAKGYQVWYHPETEIIHFKGKSSPKKLWRLRGAFYRAMILFSRKYQHTYGAFFPAWIVYLGIIVQGGVNIGASLVRNFTACLIDLGIINAMLWASITVRFALHSSASPYQSGDIMMVLIMHYLISTSFLAVFVYRRMYTKSGYSPANMLVSGFSALVIFLACVFFIKSMAFSRIAVAISSALTVPLLVGWREVLPRAIVALRRMVYSTGRVIVLGSDSVASQLIDNVETDSSAQVIGILWPGPGNPPGQFKGYQVLGTMEEMSEVLKREHADVLLIATPEPWYSHVIKTLANTRIRHITIRWVPHELFAEKRENIPLTIPLQDFTV